ALSSSQFVVTYQDTRNSSYGTAVAGTVSGTTISFGSEYIFNTDSTNYISSTALSSSKFVVAYADGGNSSYGTARVGTISGTSISYGSERVFETYSISHISVTALDASTFVVAYDRN